jgi:hypothetical protein
MKGSYTIKWNEHKPSKLVEISKKDIVLRTIGNAKTAVEFVTGITFDMMNKNTRKRKIVYPKFMLYTLLRRYTPLKLNEIGNLYSRPAWNPTLKRNITCHPNHASILSGIENIQNVEHIGNRDEWYAVWVQVQETFKEYQYPKFK